MNPKNNFSITASWRGSMLANSFQVQISPRFMYTQTLWHFSILRFLVSVFYRVCGQWSVLLLANSPGGGATWMARGGIRLVHGHTKSTLILYFSGLKIDPKYAFLHAFFLICPSCPFQNLSKWPKTHPFFQFCTFLHP